MAKLLTERFSFDGGRVGGTDDAPVIENVLLCGPVSANRRRYLKTAFAGDRVKLYNGVPVYLNHGRRPDGRPYQEQVGTVRNARHRADGMPVGDIAINPKKPYAEAFLWDARHQPTACGMSHVAHCETARAADGWDEVVAVVGVESVDVISAGGAATTRGLFEGKGMGLTVRHLAEALARHPLVRAGARPPLRRLAEMDGMDAAPAPGAAPPAPDADPADGIKEAFKSAVMYIVDQALAGDLDPKEALGKIKKLMASHGEVNGSTDADTDTDADLDADTDDALPESRRKPDPWVVLAEARRECGPEYNPGPAELQALALLPTAEARRAYLNEQRQKVAEARREAPRSGRAGATRSDAKPPKSLKELREFTSN